MPATSGKMYAAFRQSVRAPYTKKSDCCRIGILAKEAGEKPKIKAAGGISHGLPLS